jgi:hypothetical protein
MLDQTAKAIAKADGGDPHADADRYLRAEGALNGG